MVQIGSRLFILRSDFVNGSAVFVYDLLNVSSPPILVPAPPGAFKSGSERGALVVSDEEKDPQLMYWVDGGFVATFDVAPPPTTTTAIYVPLKLRGLIAESSSRSELLGAGFVVGDDDDGDQLFIPAARDSNHPKTFSSQVFSSGIAAASSGRLAYIYATYLTVVDVSDAARPKVMFGFDFTGSELKTPRATSNVALQQGRYLYYIGDVCEYAYKCFVSLVIIDIDASARTVKLLGEVEHFATAENGAFVDIVLRGRTLVSNKAFAVFDISDRRAPKHIYCAGGAQSSTPECQDNRLHPLDLPGTIAAPRCASIAGCIDEIPSSSAVGVLSVCVVVAASALCIFQ